MKDDIRYTYMSGVMKAMAHPTRLYILDLLHKQEHCVCELQEKIGDDMSTVSRHLAVLKNAGLISSRKVSNQVWYKLLCPCVLDIYECVMEVNSRKKEIRGKL